MFSSNVAPAVSRSVIHVEGMDLAGKSTATAAIVSHADAVAVRRNALTEDNPVYSLADNMRRAGAADAHTLGHLYVAATLFDLNAYSDPEGLTIQDSTVLLRSLAYNKVVGEQEIVRHLAALLPVHPRFGITIVLTATLEARLERLASRRRLQPEEVAPDDLAVERSPERFMAMEAELVALACEHFKAHVIDTTPLEPDQVARMILDLTRDLRARCRYSR